MVSDKSVRAALRTLRRVARSLPGDGAKEAARTIRELASAIERLELNLARERQNASLNSYSPWV